MPADAEPTPAPAEQTRISRKRGSQLLRVFGIAAAVVAVVLCIDALASQWKIVSHAISHMALGWMTLALVASAASMTGLGLLWWRCLHLFGSPATATDSVAWYFGGELGKYLPGGVWTVLGRGELARRGGGVSRANAYATTLISYGAMCIGAAMVCGVFAPFLARDADGLGYGWLLLALIPAGLIVVHPIVMSRVFALAERLTKGRLALQAQSWAQMVRLVAWSIPTWLLLGAAAAMVTRSFHFDQQPARVAFAAVAAWIIGFLAVPVPAGAGLRELVFIGLSGLDVGPGAAVAAGARLLLILVDAVGGIAGLGRVRRVAAQRDADEAAEREPDPAAPPG